MDDLYDQVQRLNAHINALKSELALTRQHLREIQQWRDTTQAYLVDPQQAQDREEWNHIMREGMI